ncbi:homeobox-leucine zipper protein HOX33-like [Cornus florida]|uniref:homeobox-leucine zipper protein HOX33-like n=1 Tax=Cornus florida TaxID=4283 RepID=UPI002899707D|nr:homeobox-leucine zipper protein HOX33-like [Cornus florida]
MAVAPSRLGTFMGPRPLPGSLEALTLAPWICRSYGTHTGDDGSLSDLPNKPPYRCIKCWLDDRKRRGKFRRQNYTERKKSRRPL